MRQMTSARFANGATFAVSDHVGTAMSLLRRSVEHIVRIHEV